MLVDISGAIPWRAIRGGKFADQNQITDPEIVDPQPTIITKPSPFHTRNESIRIIVDSLVMRGNAYLWLSGFDGSGFPTVAVPVSPDDVEVTWKEGSHKLLKQYVWRDTVMSEGDDFLHIYLNPVPGSPKGQSPLDAARSTFTYAKAEADFGGEFFGSSATPAGVIDHPGRLDENEAKALREQWNLQHAGGRGTAVLSGGVTYKPISITPENAQFLQTRAFSNQQIATLLGIPPFMLNAGQPQGTASALTYQNLSQIFEELYRMTISPVYLARVEESFQRILPRGQSVRFDTTELLRTDDANRWASQKVALDAGILTLDEVRDMEGRQPIPEPEPEPIPAPLAVEPEPEAEPAMEESQA
jgi:HK97 family phage portal protein